MSEKLTYPDYPSMPAYPTCGTLPEFPATWTKLDWLRVPAFLLGGLAGGYAGAWVTAQIAASGRVDDLADAMSMGMNVLILQMMVTAAVYMLLTWPINRYDKRRFTAYRVERDRVTEEYRLAVEAWRAECDTRREKYEADYAAYREAKAAEDVEWNTRMNGLTAPF